MLFNETHPVQFGRSELQHFPRVLRVQLSQINYYVSQSSSDYAVSRRGHELPRNWEETFK